MRIQRTCVSKQSRQASKTVVDTYVRQNIFSSTYAPTSYVTYIAKLEKNVKELMIFLKLEIWAKSIISLITKNIKKKKYWRGNNKNEPQKQICSKLSS